MKELDIGSVAKRSTASMHRSKTKNLLWDSSWTFRRSRSADRRLHWTGRETQRSCGATSIKDLKTKSNFVFFQHFIAFYEAWTQILDSNKFQIFCHHMSKSSINSTFLCFMSENWYYSSGKKWCNKLAMLR